MYQAQVSNELKISKSNVNYWAKKLEKEGYIRCKQSVTPSTDGTQHIKTRGSIILYDLTVEGTRLLDGYEGVEGFPVVRLHNVSFRYPIIVPPRVPVDWKRVKMRNWTQYRTRINGISVKLNGDSSLELSPKPISGYCVWELFHKVGCASDELAKHLEERLEMRLGFSSVSRRPHFGIKNPASEKYTESFELSTDIGRMDRSEGVGEIDYFSPQDAADYIRMLKYVKGIWELLWSRLREPRFYRVSMPEVLH